MPVLQAPGACQERRRFVWPTRKQGKAIFTDDTPVDMRAPGTGKTQTGRLRVFTLIETAKLNGVDPHERLTRTLTTIVNGHKQSRVNDLLPWNYAQMV